jgi:hypothetical protein
MIIQLNVDLRVTGLSTHTHIQYFDVIYYETDLRFDRLMQLTDMYCTGDMEYQPALI